MAVVLQIGERQIQAEEIVPLLAGYQMLPQLLREVLIDQAIGEWERSATHALYTDEELAAAQQEFYQKNEINSDETRDEWQRQYGMTAQQLDQLAVRDLKIDKYKHATWGHKIESYFLNRKGRLDKAIYSLIRVKDLGLAQELYFRVLEGEQSFSELARTYSEGPEAQTDGLIGPVELSVPHPTLAQILTISQPGQLIPPTRIGDWMVIVRLERFVPAQLDDAMRRRLLNELFETWLQEQLVQLSDASSPDPAATSTLS
ncbi:MAG TPA: peptidylprolyl isomerase [Chroococcidiopsis sp.]